MGVLCSLFFSVAPSIIYSAKLSYLCHGFFVADIGIRGKKEGKGSPKVVVGLNRAICEGWRIFARGEKAPPSRISAKLKRSRTLLYDRKLGKPTQAIHHLIYIPYAYLSQSYRTLFHISTLHVVLWGSLSGTLSVTLRIVFQSHLVLCVSINLIVRNNFTFCYLHYFSNFFSKFWYHHFIQSIFSC